MTVPAVLGEIAAGAELPFTGGRDEVNGLVEGLLHRRRPFTVVVDGLDEASTPVELADALRRLADGAADAGLRLLVGSRPSRNRQLIDEFGRRAQIVDLDAPEYLHIDDLAVYVRRRLLQADVPPGELIRDTPYRGHESLAAEVAAEVARNAYPTFLIAQLVSRSLLNSARAISLDDVDWQRFPTDVPSAMRTYMNSFGAGRERIEDLLRALAYAYGEGLPADQLWADLATVLSDSHSSYSLEDVRWLLENAADYLIEAVTTEGVTHYRLYHQALADYLREPARQRVSNPSMRVFEALVARVPMTLDSNRDWLASHEYIHKYLSIHAADAGKLNEVVDDPAFLVAAEPFALFDVLDRSTERTALIARTYRHAYHQLLGRSPSERAAYLQLAAYRTGASELAHRVGNLKLKLPWSTSWVHERPLHPHYVLTSHQDDVNALAVTVRMGRTVVVSGSSDRTLQVRDLDSRQLVVPPLEGHEDAVRAVATGTRRGRPIIVSAGDDHTVRVWDLESGEQVLPPLLGHTGPVMNLTLCEMNGRPVAVSGSSYDNSLRIWDLESGQPVMPPWGRDIPVESVVTGTRAGRTFVAFSEGEDGTIEVWDLEAGRRTLPPLKGRSNYASVLAVSQSAGHPVLISASHVDDEIHLWDLESGRLLRSLVGDAAPWDIAAGDWAGRTVLVAGGGAQTIWIWDLESGRPLLSSLEGHVFGIRAVGLARRGALSVILSAGNDGTVRVWDLEPEPPSLPPPPVHLSQVHSVAVGRRAGRPVIISGSDDRTVRIWDLHSGQPVLPPLEGHGGSVHSVAVGRQAGRPVIISGSLDRTVRIWDLHSGQPVLPPLEHPARLEAIAIGERAGRPMIVVGGYEHENEMSLIGGRIWIWDLESGQLVLPVLEGHLGPVTQLAVVSRAGRSTVVSGDYYGMIWIWDLDSSQRVLSLHTPSLQRDFNGEDVAHRGWLTGMATWTLGAESGIASVAADAVVRIWNITKGKLIHEIEIEGFDPSIALGENGELVVGHRSGLLVMRLSLPS
jgi:WD40 repeat protein